jgi:hypothetical protein
MLNQLNATILGVILEIIPNRAFSFLRHGRSKDELDLTLNVSSPKNILKNDYGKLVLMDSFVTPHWALINAVAASKVAEITSSKMMTFGFSKRNLSEDTLYRSLGVNNHLKIRLNPLLFIKAIAVYVNLNQKIYSGTKIIDLHIDKVNIGIDVYESFLRRGHATVDLNSRDLYRELWRGIQQHLYFKPLFIDKKVTALLVSHDNYVGPGLLTRMAFHYKVPVILINPFEINILSRPFHLYERFARYRVYFSAQSENWRELSLHKAQIELRRRISGEIGIGTMGYQRKSAFTQHRIENQISPSQHKKLLVLSHDFFDNPHAYTRMLFDDFIDWLSFVADCCAKNRIDCYIKLHRDFSEIEYQIVLEFQTRNPFVVIVDPEVSYHQLFDEGIRFVTTCYGSAGHELPLLGFTVINASYNPHVAFSFNHHAGTKDEYYNLLKDQIPIVIDETLRNEIYMFYSVHSFLMWPDSFNMKSFSEFNSFCDSAFVGQKALRYLENHFYEISELLSTNLEDAIAERRVFSVEKSLPRDLQQNFAGETHYESFFNKFI